MESNGYAIVTIEEVCDFPLGVPLEQSISNLLRKKGAPIIGTFFPRFKEGYEIIVDQQAGNRTIRYIWRKK